MAVNDITTVVPTSVANAASLTIQPGAGAEWLVKNIYYGGAVEFYRSDGTNSIKFDNDTAWGARLNCSLLLTNTSYLTVKNVSGGAIYISYDGLVTK